MALSSQAAQSVARLFGHPTHGASAVAIVNGNTGSTSAIHRQQLASALADPGAAARIADAFDHGNTVLKPGDQHCLRNAMADHVAAQELIALLKSNSAR